MKGFMLAAAMALLSAHQDGVAQAKEHYVVKETKESHQHKRPKVEASTEKCAYDTLSFKVCGTYGAAFKAGWEWEQESYNLVAENSYYLLKLNLFAEQGLDLEGLFSADRLYENKTQVILDDFKTQLTIQLKRWYSLGRTCIAIYPSVEDLVFEVIIRQKFIEFSKNIIEHLWTLDNWDSIYALYLDEIDLSEATPIYVFKREF